MDKYTVKLLSGAIRSLDNIYAYIAIQLKNELSAVNIIDQLEEGILSLETMPLRGAKCRFGPYAKKEFRQLFIKNYVIIYRVDHIKKQVIIVTIRYMRSQIQNQ